MLIKKNKVSPKWAEGSSDTTQNHPGTGLCKVENRKCTFCGGQKRWWTHNLCAQKRYTPHVASQDNTNNGQRLRYIYKFLRTVSLSTLTLGGIKQCGLSPPAYLSSSHPPLARTSYCAAKNVTAFGKQIKLTFLLFFSFPSTSSLLFII